MSERERKLSLFAVIFLEFEFIFILFLLNGIYIKDVHIRKYLLNLVYDFFFFNKYFRIWVQIFLFI